MCNKNSFYPPNFSSAKSQHPLGSTWAIQPIRSISTMCEGDRGESRQSLREVYFMFLCIRQAFFECSQRALTWLIQSTWVIFILNIHLQKVGYATCIYMSSHTCTHTHTRSLKQSNSGLWPKPNKHIRALWILSHCRSKGTITKASLVSQKWLKSGWEPPILFERCY